MKAHRRARGGKAGTEPLRPESFHQYNAQGSPEEHEETAKSDGFKRGGAMKKRKRGGHVEGEAARHHLGRRARGGAAHEKKESAHERHMHEAEGGRKANEERREHEEHRARGGHVKEHEHRKEHEHKREHEHRRARGGATPFSSAHKISPPGNDHDKSGPGEQAASIP